MALRLDGRAVLITGAGSGIGRATARLAAAEGALIAAVDVDGEALSSTVDALRQDGGRVHARIADVADPPALTSSIESLTAELGPVHGVFANAAILPPPVPAGEVDWQEWDQVLRVNLTAAVATLVSSLAHVVDGGSLVDPFNGGCSRLHPVEYQSAVAVGDGGGERFDLRHAQRDTNAVEGSAQPPGQVLRKSSALRTVLASCGLSRRLWTRSNRGSGRYMSAIGSGW